jgi:putative ABC transport system ATP-binding protein
VAENLALASRRGQTRGLGFALAGANRDRMFAAIQGLGMGLETRLDNAIGSLSGGQRQALTLLMATWLKPKLLLLDEHTAALDPRSADQVVRITDRIIARDGLTAMMVTHSMQQAVTYGDRLVMMHRGQIIHDVRGAEKRRLRVEDLMARFEEVRRADLLDTSAADLLRVRYV